MKVKLARTAGFCMGVRRAMELVLTEANKDGGPLYTFGPLIHNGQVMELLQSKGVEPVEDLRGIGAGRIVIRAHGIPPERRKAIKETGLKVIDATCPRVARVQAIIHYHTQKGYAAVIVGDKDHAEVIGLMGYGRGPVHVIREEEDVQGLSIGGPLFVVAQTTQDEENYRRVVKSIRTRYPDALVFDTICDATHQRQQEVRAFKGHVDAVVVVGGRHSGNTQRLAQVARSEGLPTFHVETERDIERERLSGMGVIGVTAGASTPNWMIKNVVKEIEGIRDRRELFFGRWTRRLFKFLVLSNLMAASGAASLAYAAAVLAGRSPNLVYPSLAFLYVYAMHVFNRFLDKGASAYNDPERARFHQEYRTLLVGTGLAAIAAALVLSFIMGPATFAALAGFSLLGVVYSVPLFPLPLKKRSRFLKLKDIPGSKALSEAFAWVAIICAVPLFRGDPIGWSAVAVTTIAVFSISYAKSVMFDIFQVQGDLIAGAETLPIVLGERKTSLLLKLILSFSALILAAAPVLGLVSPFSYLVLLTTLTLWLCLWAYEKQWLLPGIPLEALVEGNLFLAGLLGLAHHVLL